MKITFNSIVLLAFGTLLFSCKKDNYEEPESKLTGRLHYRGETIEVAYDQVPFEIYQFGFGRTGRVGTFADGGLNVNTTITPEGNYSLIVFDGEYKFFFRPGQGPFFWPQTGGKTDSITITVNGNTTKDIEVEPYHMVRSPQFSQAAGRVSATFRIDKIITDAARTRAVERVTLYINKNQFVSNLGNQSIANATIAGTAITDPANVSLNVAVPTISPTQNYVFARIGVKTVGVEDWIFSPVQKIQF